MEAEQGKFSRQMLGSRIVLGLFVLAVVVSFGASFYKFYVLRDYPIQSQIECDPTTEVCFVYHCDATVEECTGDDVADTSYYKLIERNAKHIPLCNPVNDGCVPLECPDGEESCSITFCDANAEDGSECSNPDEYNAQFPLIEEPQVPVEEPADVTIPEMNVETNTVE